MKIGLVGPGAIGSVVAGAVGQPPGVELAIGARTAFDRLRVTGVEPSIDAPVRVLVAPPARVAMDIVLVATKAHQIASTRPWLDAWAGPGTLVVVVQNGVEQVESGRAL